VKRNDKVIGLQDLVEGFLFSLQAEGRALAVYIGARSFTYPLESTPFGNLGYSLSLLFVFD